MKAFKVERRLELTEGHFAFKVLSHRLSKLSHCLYRFQGETGKSFTTLSCTLREILKTQRVTSKKYVQVLPQFQWFAAHIFPYKCPSNVLTLASETKSEWPLGRWKHLVLKLLISSAHTKHAMIVL